MPRATQQELRDRLRVCKDVGSAESLADITVRLKDIWQTHDSFLLNGCNPTYSITVMRREGPTAVGVMSQAAGRCLALLVQQGIKEDGSFVLPQDAASVTCVRMLLHVLARFVSDWILLQDDKQAIAQDSGVVADAVNRTGLMPLVSKACSLLAHSMRQQQQQGVAQEHLQGRAMPPITLASELMNTWQVLASSITEPPRALTILTNELVRPSVGPAAELALTILRCWDGSEPGNSIFKRGAVNAAGILGEDTNMPIEECWRIAVKGAAGAGDTLADAQYHEGWAAEQRRNGRGLSDALPPEVREAKASEVLSLAQVNQLLLFHLGLVAQTMTHQLHDDDEEEEWEEVVSEADSDSCSSMHSGSHSLHHDHQLQLDDCIRLFEGLDMPAVAAYGRPVTQFNHLSSPHVFSALQAACQSCFLRSQAAAVAASPSASDRQEVGQGTLDSPDYNVMAAELLSPVAEVVFCLIKYTRPQRGQKALQILTYGLDLLSLLLNDWLSIQHTQQDQQEKQRGKPVGAPYPAAAAAAGSGISSAVPASSSLSQSVSGPAVSLSSVLTMLGATCRQAEAEHQFNDDWLIPMPWGEMLAAEEAMKLLPKFGGLLRDLLLSMSPEDCTIQLAVVCRQDPVTVAETLEWVLRNCFRATVGILSTRSYHGKAEGTCETELTPDLINPMVCKAAEQHYTTAAADAAVEVGSSAAGVPAAAAAPAGLSDCLADGLGSLVLLCYQVVQGVTVAPWYQQQQQGHQTAACLLAGKHQAALLNSCLKLLRRLAVKAGDSSRGTLTAAGRWWAVKTAAAISAFGVTLANSVSVNSSSAAGGDKTTSTGANSGNSSSKDSDFQSAVVWVSMAARSWLFVSQQLVEASGCKGLRQQEIQELLGGARRLSGLLDGDLLHNRKCLQQLQAQCDMMIKQTDELLQIMEATDASIPQQGLVHLADCWQVFCSNLAAQVPSPYCCNNTGCMTLSEVSELVVCRAKCTACKRAYFCSKECQAEYWKQHKEACKELAA